MSGDDPDSGYLPRRTRKREVRRRDARLFIVSVLFGTAAVTILSDALAEGRGGECHRHAR